MTETTNNGSLGRRIASLRGIGPAIRTVWLDLTLPRQIDRIYHKFSTIESQAKEQERRTEERIALLREDVQAILKKTTYFDGEIERLKHHILRQKLAVGANTTAAATSTGTDSLLADDHDLDSFYVDFEDKFRGTEEEITHRLRVYEGYFKKSKIDFGATPVLDIGCGRGELLGLLQEWKIRGIGLDINNSMVERCKEKGYEAVCQDAMTYLIQQPDNSVGAITGFHIVEHIPFGSLLPLFQECHRVLAPGGVVIFETPNPENLHVGSCSFYYDPSHLHPLVPDVLAFALESRGFQRAEILRLHPKGDGNENKGRDDQYLAAVLERFYGPQDYAAIGYKA